MRTSKSLILAATILFAGVSFFSSCKKDDPGTTTTPTTLTSQQVSQVQNADVQDAIADKTDQDVDKTVDELQTNNYVVPATKSGSSITITVDHPDSTTFPKNVTITYSNYQDSTADESFVKNGKIIIAVTASTDKKLTTRTHTFENFAVTTDSTTVTVNGTRMVARTKHVRKLTGTLMMKLSVIDSITDNITANVSYSITKTGSKDSLKFTRVVSKIRKSVLHYDNVGGKIWKSIRFKNILAKDTITYSGTVSGINEKGDNYTKTVNVTSPLTISFFKNSPVLVSGTLNYIITGASSASYTITYKQDLPNHPYKTLVTVVNNTTQKTHSFDRRFGGKLTKWW